MNALFDPKVIYDHYENRFLVVALERFHTGTNPNAGNTSRILLAVSKTASPAGVTDTDWYYMAISGEELIGGYDYWADYPGFEVDEEAVYITNNLFLHEPLSDGPSQSRLWIVDKGVSGGFYGGGTASVTKHDPYALSGYAVTTMPAQVYGSGGIDSGGSGGTYLVGYSGLTYGGLSGAEVVQVVHIDNPLAVSPTFSVAQVSVLDIEDIGGAFGWPALPDAPQLGSSTDIEVNDRRALDAVWRNNKLWFTTTINPNSSYDSANAGQTTAHWFRLDTSAALTFDDQGNIGGEDIEDNTYTFFPSLAVNNNGDAAFGFCASAPTIYAGAYTTAHLANGPAGAVQAAETVRAGTDYYVRTFGGPRNRWGDFTGAALDPTDDNVVWIFNQYAMARSIGEAPDDGRWGTAWASNLFTTWDSYGGGSGDTQSDYFDDYDNEHVVYMYGIGFVNDHSYKVAFYDGDAINDNIDTQTKTSDSSGNLSANHTLANGVDTAGDWNVIVCEPTEDPPATYDAGWSSTLADDAFYVDQSAIPEFPTVPAAIAALALPAGTYFWMRRRVNHETVPE
ncbi:hypothetical protein ACFLYF_01915 [Chloroflexota bacterium]